MDHAYIASGNQVDQSKKMSVTSDMKTLNEVESEEVEQEVEEEHENYQNEEYDLTQDQSLEEDNIDDGEVDSETDGITAAGVTPVQAFTVLLPTEEWMQMLPPHYLLHYIRERTVFRDTGRATREGREATPPLKRGWLQGAWRETLKDAIAKQTGLPCVIYFHSSNFLKQPFSRKVGPPLWRVRACCRQDDGLCLRFSLRVQDFHPSKPNVEITVIAEGTLLEGPEGEARHTFTASDHMRAIKSMQRYNVNSPQACANGFVVSDGALDVQDSVPDQDDGEVQRYKLTIPTQHWISFLPPEASEAYVLERSPVSKDRLALDAQETWSRARVLAPRVSKDCRLYLKRALADLTGLPCRIGLTGRCHLKPPFSRKKRAPLFVTNGFCGRKDHKCLRFKFTVQDFDPKLPNVDVDVEVRGTLLTGPEGDERHSRRPVDDATEIDSQLEAQTGTKRAVAALVAASGEGDGDEAGGAAKRPRLARKPLVKRVGAAASSDAYAQAVQALQTESWPIELEGQAEMGASSDGGNMIQILDEEGHETALGEDAARELVQLANEALSLAGGNPDGTPGSQLTATKIVQSGDQVFIFVADPHDPESGEAPTIEAVEVSSEEIAALERAGGEIHMDTLPDGYVVSEPTPQDPLQGQESPRMEYHWEIQLPMSEWLRLLPAKSLRYYIHERTVGREVWVEEGWEKQFRCQTLQQGWRDAIRHAVVEQTDIPCQVCFRGRSSLKLPFSRKHAAALWRTQGYCAKGDGKCLIYKFCVQDFHPDDEMVTVTIEAVGRLHPDCRRWFTGVGTVVSDSAADKDWTECDADLEGPDGDGADGEEGTVTATPALAAIKREPEPQSEWEPEQGDAEQPSQASDAGQGEQDIRVSTSASLTDSASQELFQGVVKSVEALMNSLRKVRNCPLKMQAVTRMVRNATSLVSAPCKTPDCLCRPLQLGPVSRNSRYRWPEKVKPRPKDSTVVSASSTPVVATPMLVSRPPSATSPPPLTVIGPPPLQPTTRTAVPRPAGPALRPAAPKPAVRQVTRPAAPQAGPGPSRVQAGTRSVPVVFSSASTTPTIIKLSPSQMAAGQRLVSISPGRQVKSPSRLVNLSSAIERSAMPTPAVIKPVIRAAADTSPVRRVATVTPKAVLSASSPTATPVPAASSTPAGSVRPVRRPALLAGRIQVSSSQDRRPAAKKEDEAGGDPSWIVEEMRSVILDGEEPQQSSDQENEKVEVSEASATTKTRSKAPVPTPAQRPATARAAVSTKAADKPKVVLAAGDGAAPRPSHRIHPPSRPTTRSTKVIVSTATSSDPPPLVPFSKGSAVVKTEIATVSTASKKSETLILDSPNKASTTASDSASPQAPKVPTRTVQTRMTSMSNEKTAFPKGGKFLILKPSAPILRSSPRKPS